MAYSWTPSIGKGTTIAWGTSTFVCQILDVSGPDIKRDAIDTSHMGTTTAKTKAPGWTDNGELSYTVQYDPSLTPPINAAAETITLTGPKMGAATHGPTMAFTGFMTGYSPKLPKDGLMTADIKITVSGDITYGAAA